MSQDRIDIIITAYMAASQSDSALADHIQGLQTRHSVRPDLRLGLAACGPSDQDVFEADVSALLCSDGQIDRRRAARVIAPTLFRSVTIDWLESAAKGKVVSGESFVATENQYSPDVLLARNDPERRETWLGQF
jgi:hypothetical protein